MYTLVYRGNIYIRNTLQQSEAAMHHRAYIEHRYIQLWTGYAVEPDRAGSSPVGPLLCALVDMDFGE